MTIEGFSFNVPEISKEELERMNAEFQKMWEDLARRMHEKWPELF